VGAQIRTRLRQNLVRWDFKPFTVDEHFDIVVAVSASAWSAILHVTARPPPPIFQSEIPMMQGIMTLAMKTLADHGLGRANLA